MKISLSYENRFGSTVCTTKLRFVKIDLVQLFVRSSEGSFEFVSLLLVRDTEDFHVKIDLVHCEQGPVCSFEFVLLEIFM